jgi:hypothetical protein
MNQFLITPTLAKKLPPESVVTITPLPEAVIPESISAFINQADIDNPALSTAQWRQFDLPAYGLTVKHPVDVFVEEKPLFKPSAALSSFILAPTRYKDFLSHQTPITHLLIYRGTDRTLLGWFEAHATLRPFDDPAVSMKDSPYFFRQYTEPQKIILAGQEGLTFSSYTMNGPIVHVILRSPDGAHVIDWSFPQNALLGDMGSTFKTILTTLSWVQ